MPQFSIILPAYNAEPFIETTIASVLAQSYTDFELLVIDDGSRDRTAQLVTAIRDSRIRLLSRENGGIARARNTGLENAKAPWIAFLDHDDYWHPHKLAAQSSVLTAQPEVGVVYGEFLTWNPEEKPHFPNPTVDADLVAPELSGFIFHRLIETNWVLFTTAVLRRTVFEVVGGFDPAMPPADDWVLALRAAQYFRFVKLQQPVALYRQHSGQTSKRPMRRNIEFEVREQALLHFGGIDPITLVGVAENRELNPQEAIIDHATVRARQFNALFNHGISMYRAGYYADARRSMLAALRYKPYAWKAAVFAVAALYLSTLFEI